MWILKSELRLSGLAVGVISPTEPSLQPLLIFLMCLWVITVVSWGSIFFCWLIVLFVAMEYTVITFPWLPYLGASVWAWFWLCFRVFSDLFISDCNNLPFLCSPTATWELVFLLKVWTWIDYQVHSQVNYSIVRALGLTFLVKIFKWYWVFF